MLSFPKFSSPPIPILPSFSKPSNSPSIKLHSICSTISLKSPPTNPTFFHKIKPIITSTCIIAAAIAAVFAPQPFTIPAAVASPAGTVVSAEEENKNSTEATALAELLETKLSSKDVNETEWIVERLLELEPWQRQWRVLRAHILINKGEMENACVELEKMVEEDPFFVEAYHGMVLIQSRGEGGMDDVVRRIDGMMEICRREKKVEEMKNFKLLSAQVSLLGGKYDEALMVYDQLEAENSEDFRPYVCRGVVFSLMGRGEEAKKQFQKYRELVPDDHPFKNLFHENMVMEGVFGGRMVLQEK